MKALTVEQVKGQRRAFKSVGWKTPNAGECRCQFYALDESGKPLVVTLQPALPTFYSPGCDVVFSREPFPEAVCMEISPCRLLPPPCYQSQAEFETQVMCLAKVDPWPWVYWETHRQVMILEPSDDGALQQLLDEWLTAMRKAYSREVTALRGEIELLKHGSPEKLKLKSEAERRKRLGSAKRDLRLIESENPIDGVPCKGRLKLTLADVKRGCEGIRDTWLHKEWADKNGEDLAAMARERITFRRWLETHTGTPAIIHDMRIRERRQGISPPSFGVRYNQNPQFQEAAAKVRFRVRFADGPGTVVYLAECELREDLTAPELDEVGKLNALTQPTPAADLHGLRCSPNYRQLFWTENGNDQRANLTKTQAAAFSALLHAAGRTLAREEWRQAIYGDSPPADFRPDKTFHYGDGRKVWKRFVCVEGCRYRLGV